MYNIALLQLARMMLFDEILLRPLNFLILSWTLDFKIAWLPTIPRWMENNIVGQHSKWVVIMIISCKTDGFVWKRSTGAARDSVVYSIWGGMSKQSPGLVPPRSPRAFSLFHHHGSRLSELGINRPVTSGWDEFGFFGRRVWWMYARMISQVGFEKMRLANISLQHSYFDIRPLNWRSAWKRI